MKSDLTVLGLVNTQSIMHIVLHLYVLKFDSIVVINVFISISSPKLNNKIFISFDS